MFFEVDGAVFFDQGCLLEAWFDVQFSVMDEDIFVCCGCFIELTIAGSCWSVKFTVMSTKHEQTRNHRLLPPWSRRLCQTLLKNLHQEQDSIRD